MLSSFFFFDVALRRKCGAFASNAKALQFYVDFGFLVHLVIVAIFMGRGCISSCPPFWKTELVLKLIYCCCYCLEISVLQGTARYRDLFIPGYLGIKFLFRISRFYHSGIFSPVQNSINKMCHELSLEDIIIRILTFTHENTHVIIYRLKI